MKCLRQLAYRNIVPTSIALPMVRPCGDERLVVVWCGSEKALFRVIE